jgi:hypothetical protein
MFQVYVSTCFICFRRMLQMYILNISVVFRCMFHVFHLDVAMTIQVYFNSILHMLQWSNECCRGDGTKDDNGYKPAGFDEPKLIPMNMKHAR